MASRILKRSTSKKTLPAVKTKADERAWRAALVKRLAEPPRVSPVDFEELAQLIDSAEAVATLIQCDNAFDESVHRSAAGAVCEVLRRARLLILGRAPRNG